MLNIKTILAAVDLHDDAEPAYLIKAAGDMVSRYGAKVKVLSGRTYARIIGAANEVDADLILVAAHNNSMKNLCARNDFGACRPTLEPFGAGYSGWHLKLPSRN